jgi:hypothetical protein
MRAGERRVSPKLCDKSRQRRDKWRHLPLSRTVGVIGNAYFLVIAASCRRLMLASDSSRSGKRFGEGFRVCGRERGDRLVFSQLSCVQRSLWIARQLTEACGWEWLSAIAPAASCHGHS